MWNLAHYAMPFIRQSARQRIGMPTCIFETHTTVFPGFPSLLLSRSNSNRASIAKIGRKTYTYLYPTMVVLPDGSTMNIRYKEPRKIITLPFDITSLTEDELRLRLLKRKPKMEIKAKEEMDDGFDASRYLQPKKKK